MKREHDAGEDPGTSIELSHLSQEHLETIFNASHDVFFVLDGGMKTILHVNDAVERVLGYSSVSLRGTQFPVLITEYAPDYLERCQFFDGVFGPVSFRRKDGGVCLGEVTAAVIPWDEVPALLYTLRDATQRAALEQDRAALIHDLQQALATVQRLSGLLPICASCKRIRDDEGYWETVEAYITAHSSAHFSHGICPDCRERLYPDLPHVPLLEAPLESESTARRFRAAEQSLEEFTGSIDRAKELRLYGLRQQALLGDCAVDRIDFTDGNFQARIDAWKGLHGTASERAMSLFVELVASTIHPEKSPRPDH
tara:strand:- start:573 stop:1508 length:936 start_codon:yes stop_codon:yes gene_type:complete